MKARNLILALSLAVVACGSGEAPQTQQPEDEGAFDDMVGTMDRAQGVEQQLKDAAAAQRRALEEQEN